LHIDKSNFIGADLRKEIDLKEKFDLVISLEVGRAFAKLFSRAIYKHFNAA
jgi:hypothetical protein